MAILSDIDSGNTTLVQSNIQKVPHQIFPLILYHAVYCKNLEMVRLIIESTNMDVNKTCVDVDLNGYPHHYLLSIGSTPLHMVISKLDFEIFKYLMEKGANIRQFNKRNVSPVRMLAVRWYNKYFRVEITKFIEQVINFVGSDALKKEISRFIASEITDLVMFNKIKNDFPDFDVSAPYKRTKTSFDMVLQWCDDPEVIKYFGGKNAPLSSFGRALMYLKPPDIQVLLSQYTGGF